MRVRRRGHGHGHGVWMCMCVGMSMAWAWVQAWRAHALACGRMGALARVRARAGSNGAPIDTVWVGAPRTGENGKQVV